MLNTACKDPAERQAGIQGIRSRVGYDENTRIKNDFGITIEREMAKVPGRVLLPPTVEYNQSSETKTPKVDSGYVAISNRLMRRASADSP